MKKIKNFKGVDSIIFMCYLHPKKKNFREWEFEIDGQETENSILFYDTFENGGKKIQRELFEFLENFYNGDVLPKLDGNNKLTMYHGVRQVLALTIKDNTPYIHYQNVIEGIDYESRWGDIRESQDFCNDGWYKITGDHKEDLLRMFNEYAK